MAALIAAALLLCSAVDGDTLLCARERIRVMGVDTPEMGGCIGQEWHPMHEEVKAKAADAKRRAAELVAGGVSIERYGLDRYKRTLAVVTLPDGRLLAEVLVAEGLGRKYHGEKRRSWCG